MAFRSEAGNKEEILASKAAGKRRSRNRAAVAWKRSPERGWWKNWVCEGVCKGLGERELI